MKVATKAKGRANFKSCILIFEVEVEVESEPKKKVKKVERIIEMEIVRLSKIELVSEVVKKEVGKVSSWWCGRLNTFSDN